MHVSKDDFIEAEYETRGAPRGLRTQMLESWLEGSRINTEDGRGQKVNCEAKKYS